jgi:hypothetical protein
VIGLAFCWIGGLLDLDEAMPAAHFAQRSTFAEPAGRLPLVAERSNKRQPDVGSAASLGGADEWSVSKLLLKATLHEAYEKQASVHNDELANLRNEVRQLKDKLKSLNTRSMTRFRAMEEEIEGYKRQEEDYLTRIRYMEEEIANLKDPTGVNRRREAAARRSMMRFMHGALARCFDSWRDNASDARETKAKMKRVMQRFLNGTLVRCFESWASTVQEGKEMKIKATRVVRRMMQGALVRCFEMWIDVVEDKKERMAKTRKVVQRLRNGALVQAFELWAENVMDIQETKRRILARFLNGALVRAFEHWAEQVDMLKKLRRAVARFKNRGLVSCFNLWADLVEEAADAEQERLRTLEEEKRQKAERLESLKRKILQRIKNKWLVLCFDSWADHAHDVKVCTESMYECARNSLVRAYTRTG